ncbi:hypothetical protein EWB00_011176, partial [Schistosoma japonicum]
STDLLFLLMNMIQYLCIIILLQLTRITFVTTETLYGSYQLIGLTKDPKSYYGKHKLRRYPLKENQEVIQLMLIEHCDINFFWQYWGTSTLFFLSSLLLSNKNQIEELLEKEKQYPIKSSTSQVN